jgi:hypothetical protein
LRPRRHSQIYDDAKIFTEAARAELCHQFLLMFRRVQSQKANRVAFAGFDHGEYIQPGYRSEFGAKGTKRRLQASDVAALC